jgi:hypothetical protein
MPYEVTNISTSSIVERKDFRYDGVNELIVDWPNLYAEVKVNIKS